MSIIKMIVQELQNQQHHQDMINHGVPPAIADQRIQQNRQIQRMMRDPDKVKKMQDYMEAQNKPKTNSGGLLALGAVAVLGVGTLIAKALSSDDSKGNKNTTT